MVRTSQSLKVINADPLGNNIYLQTFFNPPSNQVLLAGKSTLFKMSKEELRPVNFGSNVRNWMQGVLVVRSNPYVVVSDDKGTFTIANLPAGEKLEFRTWHEKAGFVKNVSFNRGHLDNRGRLMLSIKPGENDSGDIRLPPKLFDTPQYPRRATGRLNRL